jgi:hypothetical protein
MKKKNAFELVKEFNESTKREPQNFGSVSRIEFEYGKPRKTEISYQSGQVVLTTSTGLHL